MLELGKFRMDMCLKELAGSGSSNVRGSRKGHLRYAITGSQGAKVLAAPAFSGASDTQPPIRTYVSQARCNADGWMKIRQELGWGGEEVVSHNLDTIMLCQACSQHLDPGSSGTVSTRSYCLWSLYSRGCKVSQPPFVHKCL